MQNQVIDLMLKRRDPTVDELLRVDAFSTEIIDDKETAIGLEMQRGFVVMHRGAVSQIEGFQRQFAADDDEGPADLDPAGIDLSGRSGSFGRVMALGIVNPNNVVFDRDAMRYP